MGSQVVHAQRLPDTPTSYLLKGGWWGNSPSLFLALVVKVLVLGIVKSLPQSCLSGVDVGEVFRAHGGILQTFEYDRKASWRALCLQAGASANGGKLSTLPYASGRVL